METRTGAAESVGRRLDNAGVVQHNGAVRTKLFQVTLACIVGICVGFGSGPARAQEDPLDLLAPPPAEESPPADEEVPESAPADVPPPAAVDEILAEGWHLYSEELDFARAAEVYAQVPDHAEATEGQLLEAYEYLAACRFALGDEDGARQALAELLGINPEQNLNDPSHPPELLELLEQVRAEMPEPQPEPPPEPPPPPPPEEPPPDVGAGEEEPTSGGRPWYRTWWFWTIAGVVVVGAVTTAVVLSLPEEATPPPQGQLDPGVVQLPMTGIPF